MLIPGKKWVSITIPVAIIVSTSVVPRSDLSVTVVLN